MTILKFILWPILLTCLVWIAVVFFGPKLISAATSYFSEGRVTLTRVEVSPKLKIKAATVDFSLPFKAGNNDLIGKARAVSIDWQIKGGFALTGQIGPSILLNGEVLSSASFRLKPNSIFNWNEVSAHFEMDQLVGDNFELSKSEVSGEFINLFQDLDQADFVIPKLRAKVLGEFLEFEGLYLNVDYLNLDEPPSSQNIKASFSFQKISLPERNLEGNWASGNIANRNGEILLDMVATAAHLNDPEIEVDAKSLTLSAKHSPSATSFVSEWELAISEIKSDLFDTNIRKYHGFLTTTSSGISHRAKAFVANMELKNDQYFLGTVENGIADIVLNSQSSNSRVNLEVQGSLALERADHFSATVSVETSLPKKSFSKCLSQQCEIGPLNVEYRVAASGTSLVGSLKCEKSNCLNRPTEHQLQTDNTNKFFQAISDVGILSPLVLPLAYLALSSGKVIGEGHVLNF